MDGKVLASVEALQSLRAWLDEQPEYSESAWPAIERAIETGRLIVPPAPPESVEVEEGRENKDVAQRERQADAVQLVRLWLLNEPGLDPKTRAVVEMAKAEGIVDDPGAVLSAPTVEAVLARHRERNEAAIALVRAWAADESGYDERVWPIVKQAIEENRMSYRKRFDD
ncbi:MAG: hypothetical protein JXB47_02975 [Anaerolineae bacterium]|nr:hypothetical protein [Anaerolineae bacterium]